MEKTKFVKFDFPCFIILPSNVISLKVRVFIKSYLLINCTWQIILHKHLRVLKTPNKHEKTDKGNLHVGEILIP